LNCEHIALGCEECTTKDDEPYQCLKCMENLVPSADGYDCVFSGCDIFITLNSNFKHLDAAECKDCKKGYGLWDLTHSCEPCTNYFDDYTDCTECKIGESGEAVECLECGD